MIALAHAVIAVALCLGSVAWAGLTLIIWRDGCCALALAYAACCGISIIGLVVAVMGI